MLIFTINTIPKPQRQTRFYSRGGHLHGYDPSKKDLQFIQWQLKPYAPAIPFTGPIIADYTFYMPIPRSASKVKARQMSAHIIKHIIRPDLDNLAYLVTNAMKGIIYRDDSQIVEKHERKMYGVEPRIVIKIFELNAIEGLDDRK